MLYQSTIVPLVQILSALRGILDKAEAYSVSRKIGPETLLYARLYPDMYHFTRQVQMACDLAVKAACRLSGRDPVEVVRHEASFDDLRALLDRTLGLLRGTDQTVVNAMADKDVTFKINDRPLTMPAVDYAHRFSMPNVYFHVSMAYAILRENGVDLGKADFIGSLRG